MPKSRRVRALQILEFHYKVSNSLAIYGRGLEIHPAVGQLTSIDCNASTVPAGDRSTDTTTRAVTFSIAAGETLDCMFTNTKQQGHIVIDKVTDPPGDPTSFDFTLKRNGSNVIEPFSLTDAATPKDSGPILPGSGYDVRETVPADWELTSESCDQGESNVHNITVEPGETVNCTFTNLKQTTSISTAQSFTAQDKATITGTGSGTFNGQVDFELYKGADCGDTGELVYYERNITLPCSGTVSTTNRDPAGAGHDDPYTIEEATAGEYHWKVSYHDDPKHPDASSCVEESNLPIDNDNTPSS